MSNPLSFDQAFKFLSEEELHQTVPSIFTKVTKSSTDYIVIPTPEVLSVLAQYGWKVTEAYEARPKKEENRGLQKHYLYLRNEKHYIGNQDDIELVPEIMIVNSYDAKCSFKMLQCMYRHANKSHLILTSQQLPPVVIPHKGFESELTGRLAEKFVNNTKAAISIISQMRSKTLTPIQQRKFVQECCEARWDYRIKINNWQEILQPQRYEDEGDDLWTVFNRVQERVLYGGWTGNGNKAIKKLIEPIRELKVRQRISQIAQDYASL